MHSTTVRPRRHPALAPSHHAAERYVERVAGNVTLEVASERLRRLATKARFVCERPGRAREYRLGWMRFIVVNGLILTVYQNRA